MKKNRKSMLTCISSLTISFALLFATACGDGALQKTPETVAMGRYVETAMPTPEGILKSQFLLSDGSINLHAFDAESYEFTIYNTMDYNRFTPVETSWTPQLPADGNTFSQDYDAQDNLYLIFSRYLVDGSSVTEIPTLYRIPKDSSNLEEVPLDWYQAPGNDNYISTDQLFVLQNGDFIIHQPLDGGLIQYDGQDGRYKGEYETAYSSVFVTWENNIAILDVTENIVRIYNTDTFELARQLDFENHMRQSNIYCNQVGQLSIVNDSGLYRLTEGGNVWEKIIDGEMTSLSLPNLTYSNMLENEDGDLYLLTSDGLNHAILRYQFDPTVVSVPTQELVIYALDENPVVRRAISEFQKLHLDTRVQFHVLDEPEKFDSNPLMNKMYAARLGEDHTEKRSEMLRVMNTELLNGKGPDILIMDDMNVNPYIEKGILMDLTELVAELTHDHEMVENVLRTYEKAGRLYALPAKFIMPVMVMDADVLPTIQTLEDLAEYATAHPDKGIIGDLSPESVIEAFMPASAATWITEDGLDTQQLSDFLQAAYTIKNSGAESYDVDKNMQFLRASMEAGYYGFGHSHSLITNLYGTAGRDESKTGLLHLAMERRGNSAFTYLVGTQSKTFIPYTTAAINVNTSQPELAKEFIKLLLSGSAQSDQGKTGFPVSLAALAEDAATFDDTSIYLLDSVNGEQYLGKLPPIEVLQQFAELAKGVETPVILDTQLNQMIIEQAKGYLTDEKSLEQALLDIEEATKLYLAE